MVQCSGNDGDCPGGGGGELVSWHLLAWLELGTVLLVALAWLLYTVHARSYAVMTSAPRTLIGRRVLISAVEWELSQALAQRFAKHGCDVTVLAAQSDLTAAGVEVLQCDTSRHEQVRALAERLGSIDILVVCGAGAGTAEGAEGLDALAKTVSEELYANFHVLEELGSRLMQEGLAVWVCAGSARGSFAGAASCLQRLAHTLLHQIASRRGCSAVWCEARGERGESLAGRVVRTVVHGGSPATAADVFRELGYTLHNIVNETLFRFCKLWN